MLAAQPERTPVMTKIGLTANTDFDMIFEVGFGADEVNQEEFHEP